MGGTGRKAWGLNILVNRFLFFPVKLSDTKKERIIVRLRETDRKTN